MAHIPAGVAAGHPATARVGLAVLERGGNAVDAAAAMVLAGCVAETIFTGLGGGGFATVYDAVTRTVTCLDFFVAVPGLDGTALGSGRRVDITFGSATVPYAVGGASVAVPGTPRGVAELHQAFGRLPWTDIVSPARDLADRGVPMPAEHAALLTEIAPAMLLGDGALAYTRPDGTGRRLLRPGETVRHPGLAETLDDYAIHGPDALMAGRAAAALVTAVRADGGALSQVDLDTYRPRRLPAAVVPLGDATIHVRGNDLDAFAATVAALDDAELRAGAVARALALVDALRKGPRRSETSSLVAVDDDGNACAATHSLGLASGIWVGGVHANSMLGEGELLRGELRPGDRMPSMMVPLVAVDGAGRLVVAGGAAGGSRIRPALLQVLVRMLVDGEPGVAAVAAPRLVATDAQIHVEPGFEPEALRALAACGEVVAWPEPRPYFGGVAVAGADGPAADPRRGGLALRRV